MFPDFRYLIEGLTGYFPPEWVGIFKTFGAMVAIAFIAATLVMTKELKRREQDGVLQPQIDEKRKVKIWPHQRISEIVIVAAIAGIVGAKLFNAFENWDSFMADPVGMLISRSGLTFYGGFITATLAFYLYARKYKIPFKHLCDAAGPAIILAYGIGRLGCQLSGDGDWGVYNSAYITNAAGQLEPATSRAAFMQAIPEGERYISSAVGGRADTIPDIAYTAPSWMPRFMVAQNYPHNVAQDGVSLRGCERDFCQVLPAGVFPTPLYEFVAGILLFGILWAVRKRIRTPWHMFGLFLIFTGLERYLVEQIRVNNVYDWGFIQPSQAEIISVALMLIGMSVLLFVKRKKHIPA